MKPSIRILLGSVPGQLVLGAQPLTQPLASMSIYRSIGLADWPETEVVGPSAHYPVESCYYDLLVQ